MSEIMISLKPCYVEKILSGDKTIELRSRKLNIQNGAMVWIYTTLPKGCIEAAATIEFIEYSCPTLIWEKYAKDIAITEGEFKKYVNGNDSVSAIKLINVMKVSAPLSLGLIRSWVENFHPPQFFSHLKSDMKISSLLSRELLGGCPGRN